MGEGTVLVGIDEAGYGPLLGPLSIGFSAFRAPERTRPGFWRKLARVVSEDPADERERLIVADSKKVFSRNARGARRLERTALAFLACVEDRPAPASGHELIACGPRPPAADVLEHHPWFAHLPAALPLYHADGELDEWPGPLSEALARAGLALVDAGVRVVPAGELNRSYDRTGSKGLTLWSHTAVVIEHLVERHAGADLQVWVDRHGGRSHYADLLQETFPFAHVRTIEEAPGSSVYELSRPNGGRARLRFTERAEERSFSVALASCLAKYAREISMEAFNAYFGALQPGLKPTAGYYTDARRWLDESGEAVGRARLAPRVLVRER